jgi:hypothetical protein
MGMEDKCIGSPDVPRKESPINSIMTKIISNQKELDANLESLGCRIDSICVTCMEPEKSEPESERQQMSSLFDQLYSISLSIKRQLRFVDSLNSRIQL